MTERTKLHEIERPPIVERALLVRLILDRDDVDEAEESLEELAQLAWTAGVDVVDKLTQRRDMPEPGTHIGQGKASEIAARVSEEAIDVVVFDSELTPRQGSNLEETFGCKVLDRTQLILDIFAQHAETREGRLQVELAQLQYILPRLAGRGSIMRQQGRVGVRGPGEQKLEMDRRRIRERIDRLREDLEGVRRTRQTQRKLREERAEGVVALVGYTNAGKSSLLNAITGAQVLVQDKLFATLDPRVRRARLPGGREVLFADTVGFVQRLPHGLVAAFRATLETVKEADLLLLVVDGAHPAQELHYKAVLQVLDEIGAQDVPRLLVFNKSDRFAAGQRPSIANGNAIQVSAHTGAGLEALMQTIDLRMHNLRRRVHLRIPQSESAAAAEVHRSGRVLHMEYAGNDIVIDAELDPATAGRLARFAE